MSQSAAPTIRLQNVQKNTLQRKLYFFGALALLLVVASFFSEQLCPMTPICRI